MIKANAHKYSVSAMCRVLQVNRSTYYYEAKEKADESELTSEITNVFKASRNNYGTRKIKKELERMGKQVSRRRIDGIVASIMALDRAVRNQGDQGSIYDERGIIVF